jgi:hypothetical protein
MLVNYYFYSCSGSSAHFLTMVIPVILVNYRSAFKEWGHAVAQLVEALHYKSEGGGFDS